MRVRMLVVAMIATPLLASVSHAQSVKAGDHPNMDKSGNGLASWSAANRPVEDTDVVLWHTLGVTHIPRSEDWPVMPNEVARFMLLPANFFDRSPALDVPAAGCRHCPPGQCTCGH